MTAAGSNVRTRSSRNGGNATVTAPLDAIAGPGGRSSCSKTGRVACQLRPVVRTTGTPAATTRRTDRRT